MSFLSSNHVQMATLGGGCFWCVEAVFSDLRGVRKVEAGYSGGQLPQPTYDQVSTGTSGHAEVVQITFDPEIISFEVLLELFFSVHDPTTLNRQGPDVGNQYRSVIFYHNDEQKTIAEQIIDKLTSAKIWKTPLVTQIEPFQTFYKAEDYHQKYFKLHPKRAYCKAIISPKVAKLRKYHLEKLKTS